MPSLMSSVAASTLAPRAARPAAATGPRPAPRNPLRCLPHTTLPGRAVLRRTAAVAPHQAARPLPQQVLRTLEALSVEQDLKSRYQAILQYAKAAPAFPADQQVMANRVMGCTAQVWVTAALDTAGRVQFQATSDSELTKGLSAVLVEALSGLTPEEVLQVGDELLAPLALGPALMTPSRANGVANMLETMKKRAAMLAGALPRFPSLLISAGGLLQPQGAFAEAQAQYLNPDPAQVDRLATLLEQKRVGVVAHFYMDPEVQGVLTSAAERWPHVHISDSLVMADSAVKMAAAGCRYIAVLGVDFMSENVRAILDQAGYHHIPVYRMAAADIGCSLAEAAESPPYVRYLEQAEACPPSLHVVYINTSLRTKATAHHRVPTITCTSSNVVQTVLQAFAQVPDVTVYYGPDTYMGRNLSELFRSLSEMPDEHVRALHPAHTAASVKALLPRLRYFHDGTCIVHHIFGGEVCQLVRQGYRDAFLTAHFEVPGEMFTLAMEARKRGRGVVGSTQNILDFIAGRLQEALAAPFPERLQFVLGTEAGMITAIVRKVQAMIGASGRADVDVEIVFPVAPSSIATAEQRTADGSGGGGAGEGASRPAVTLPDGLAVVPGPAGGEGCSLEGGCAACPYMKMNTLAALLAVCERVGTAGEATLEGWRPRAYSELIEGRTMAQVGCEPILHMRHFQTNKVFSEELVSDIVTRNRVAA